LLRHLRQDVPDQSPKATALIRRIEAGGRRLKLTDLSFNADFDDLPGIRGGET